MAGAGDVRGVLPHVFGPPGTGKSSTVYKAAELLGVKAHTVNVSRISPLDLEGVQMPTKERTELKLLHATTWTQLREGDILFLDEFLRGFPEVYNGLLDILTSREVGGFKLPKVFILAASNSTIAYDAALDDRLLHLPVADPRASNVEYDRLRKIIAESLGLSKKAENSFEMGELLDEQVLPTYGILDTLKARKNAPPVAKGKSVRRLIGEAQLRCVDTPQLGSLLDYNNTDARAQGQPQNMLLFKEGDDMHWYSQYMDKIAHNKLTPAQLTNVQMNDQLVGLAKARKEQMIDDEYQLFA